MNKKIIVIIIVLVVIIIMIFNNNGLFSNDIESKIVLNIDDPLNEIELPQYSSIFRVFLYQKDGFLYEGKLTAKTQQFELKLGMDEIYNDISIWSEPQNTIVIIPIFTVSAYAESGFYSYYDGICDENCLTTEIFFNDQISYAGSQNAIKVLRLLGYETITDVELDKSPEILLEYDKVILLHNEYVTRKMFNAITTHPKVLYLYPNSLYAEINVQYEKNTITLVNGHNYPSQEIKNGYDWKFDNTDTFEYDNICDGWEFYEIDNGLMLNCYPELIIHSDKKLLEFIKEF